MSISPQTRYIRDRRHNFPNIGAIFHNGCYFRMCRNGALIVYVPHSFVDVRDRFIRLVFLTSHRVGTEYVCRTPMNYSVLNERVLGYLVISTTGNLAVWTKPFDVSGNQHIRRIFSNDTVAFMHVHNY